MVKLSKTMSFSFTINGNVSTDRIIPANNLGTLLFPCKQIEFSLSYSAPDLPAGPENSGYVLSTDMLGGNIVDVGTIMYGSSAYLIYNGNSIGSQKYKYDLPAYTQFFESFNIYITDIGDSVVGSGITELVECILNITIRNFPDENIIYSKFSRYNSGLIVGPTTLPFRVENINISSSRLINRARIWFTILGRNDVQNLLLSIRDLSICETNASVFSSPVYEVDATPLYHHKSTSNSPIEILFSEPKDIEGISFTLSQDTAGAFVLTRYNIYFFIEFSLI